MGSACLYGGNAVVPRRADRFRSRLSDQGESPMVSVPPYTLRPTRESAEIRWFTDVPSASPVHCWPEGNRGATRVFPEAGTLRREHRTVLTDLTPGTVFHYALADSAEIGRFRTLPGPVDSEFSFVVLGDPQNHRHYAETISLAAALEPDFAVVLGDFVGHAGEEQFRNLLSLSRPLLAGAGCFPVIGNHDYRRHCGPFVHDNDTIVYDRYLGDGQGNAAAVDCGPLQLITLNYPDKGALPADGEQMRWLEGELDDARAAGRGVLLFHHCPCYTSTRIDWAVEDAVLPPLLSRYGDVVLADFAGHIHTYERSVVNGVTYVTAGGASELYDFPVNECLNPYQVAAADALHVCHLTVAGGKLTCRAIAHDGSVLDTFDLSLG